MALTRRRNRHRGVAAELITASGEYVIPDGLSTLTVDRDADQGTYVEPNVWVQHR